MSSPRSFRFNALAAALLCALLPLAAARPAATPMPAYVAAMQPGWNLGNSFDATGADETSWGNPRVTREFVEQIAHQGFRSIRIPVTWSRHVGPAPDYAIDPAWMARVKQVVDWSLASGMYVMINVHHDSWQWVSAMPTQHDAVLAEFQAIWSQIAQAFANEPATLMFETVNEPTFTKASDEMCLSLLDELNTSCFRIVRESGGNNATRPIVLPTLHTGSDPVYLESLARTIAKLNDPNLIATIHYYGFWPFSVNIAGHTRFSTDSVNDLTTAFDRAASTCGTKGVPVIIGEYGVLAFDGTPGAVEHGELLKYFDYLTHSARVRGQAHMLWDNGNVFDRKKGVWRDPDLAATILQGVKGRSTTADTDVLFLAKDATVTDMTVTLNLNGNTVVSVKDGATTLNPDTDYTLDGSTLVIKRRALAKHATAPLGEKTVLCVLSNAGPAWKIHVRYCEKPVLAAATGTTHGLTIPVDYHGDLVSTVEFAYPNNSPAGPYPSTFQQYGVSFLPDYAQDRLQITSKFFSSLSASTVNLTVHLWSGAVLKYQLVINGKKVSGKPVTES